MELKKSKKANLEHKTISFRLLGLVMVCAVVGMAFEYTEYEAIEQDPIVQADPDMTTIFVDPIPDPPKQEEEVTPPPPVDLEEIKLVPDDEEVDDVEIIIPEIREEETIDTTEELIPEIDYEVVDIDPTFHGGLGAMNQWIVDNINYPELSREMGEQGKVYVQFVVSSNGKIEKVSIARGVSDALDAEAKRVVKKMPNWIPGEKDGKPVNVKFTLPIHFRLG